MQIKSVGFFGGTNLQDGSVGYLILEDLGKQLALIGIEVITGALSGAMEAPAKGATSVENGKARGYTFLGLGCNKYINEPVDCSTFCGEALVMELQYGVRLGYLLSSDAFVVTEGNAGTLVEVMAIMNFNSRGWKPQKKVAFIDPSGNWTKTLNMLKENGFISESALLPVKIFESSKIQEIINWICEK
jgi:predicted Rossmann-fold nucleotide-binding protein